MEQNTKSIEEWAAFLLSICRLSWEIEYINCVSRRINNFFEIKKNNSVYRYIKKEMRKNHAILSAYKTDLQKCDMYVFQNKSDEWNIIYVETFSKEEKQDIDIFLKILQQYM